MFFLLLAAMFVAFGLSWVSPAKTESHRILPDQVLLPSTALGTEALEILATVTLNDSCESIAGVEENFDGNKLIISIHVQSELDFLCRGNSRSGVSVSISVPHVKLNLGKQIDVYFREDSEISNLKYFGAVELKPELVSSN